jgi:hypothetical protein
MKGEMSKRTPEEPGKAVRRQLPRSRFDLSMSRFAFTTFRKPGNSELP